MNIILNLESKKEKILPFLYEWAETFEWELDEDDEPTKESYNFVYDLVRKFENNRCNKKDYKDLLFHIEQINYNEIAIQL